MKLGNASVFPMISELLSYDDERFLQCAYYMVLGRKADAGGFAVYRKRLLEGATKLEIITILARSPEGKATGARTIALEVVLMLRKLFSAPLLRGLWKTAQVPDSFDPIFYMQEYPDVAKAHVAPYFHYVKCGEKEGRCPAFDANWYLSEYPDAIAGGLEPRSHYEKYGRTQKHHPWFGAKWYSKDNPDVAAAGLDPYAHYDQIGRQQGRQPSYRPHNDYQKWVAMFDTLSDEKRVSMQARSASFALKPLISIVMPAGKTKQDGLLETLSSVRNQIYQNWELCVAYDLEASEVAVSILKRAAAEDHRIKLCHVNGGVSTLRMAATALATGEWVTTLDSDGLFSETAAYWVIEAINRHPNIAMIYSDQDVIDSRGVRFCPRFYSDWNVNLFYSQGEVPHITVYRASLVNGVNGYRSEFEGCEDFDLALRCIEAIGSDQIHHIPRVLYHRRVLDRHTANSATVQSPVAPLRISALNEHFGRLAVNANAESAPYGCRIRYSLPAERPLVSLIIPTRNGFDLLHKCVESIVRNTAYCPFEILIIDNGTSDADTLLYLQSLTARKGIRVIRADGPFNYSALNNSAVREAMGTIIGLINNDIEVISTDWLSEMVSHALRPEIAAVGAKLWYPDDTLQHGGIILAGGQAWHAHRNITKHDPGYLARASLTQSFSAVTGACLLVRRSVYEELGGLNEGDLSVTFNDVDFCIRALKAGYKNIWTPYAELYHHESATRGQNDTPAKASHARMELNFMQARWGRELNNDPAYSPNLADDREDFSLAWPPRVDNVSTR